MELHLRGVLLSNDIADIYRWFGWRDLTCPSDFTDALKNISKDEEVTVLVNSPSGDMTVGTEIRSILRRLPNATQAVVQGHAASAATLAIAGCDEIVTEPGCLLCYHNPSAVADGTAKDHRTAAKGLESAKESILDLYMARGAKDRAKLSALMNEDRWISPKEAKEYGLIDRIADLPEEEPDSTLTQVAASTMVLPRVTVAMRQAYQDHLTAEASTQKAETQRAIAQLTALAEY